MRELSAMSESIYVNCVAAFLLISAAFHILLQSQAARWLSNQRVVRVIGGGLLFLSLPSLWGRGGYFRILFGALFLSGAWRLCFPRHSITAQERSYPRWVHGCLLLAAAVAVWALRP